jgi:hypothetical protein
VTPASAPSGAVRGHEVVGAPGLLCVVRGVVVHHHAEPVGQQPLRDRDREPDPRTPVTSAVRTPAR